ncbi:MAG: hypothetical protein GY761_09740 [Hyphomicrobiales bacterium]|nr:hypothetical protein [Hyphomicrobiales bacterium]
MGNPRKHSNKQEHWTKVLRSTMQEPAWCALTTAAQSLYPWIKLEWHGPEFNNNGKIQLSVRQAASKIGVGLNAASRAFHDLQAKGFLVVTKHARLGLDGNGQSPCYEITELQLPGAEKSGGRKLYQSWKSNQDFPVHKTMTNNPKGKNGKAKPCPHYEDGSQNTVLIMKTGRP